MNRSRLSWLLPIVVFGLLFIWTEAPFFLRPDFVGSREFLFNEPSCNLWLADELNHGKILYRDVFSQYGFVSAWTYAQFAEIAGNSPLSFLHLVELEGIIGSMLAWLLLRRLMNARNAAFFLLMLLAPYLLMVGSIPPPAYTGLERLFLLVLALLWRPRCFDIEG